MYVRQKHAILKRTQAQVKLSFREHARGLCNNSGDNAGSDRNCESGREREGESVHKIMETIWNDRMKSHLVNSFVNDILLEPRSWVQKLQDLTIPAYNER
jgi:hypothetical protein